MPTGIPNPTSYAFSPQLIRESIRRGVAIPPDMLTQALAKLQSHLDAKETKFFSHQGAVMDKREVDALGIQMRAIELVMQASELLNREAVKQTEAKVVLRVDPVTGVMELIIGDDTPSMPQAVPQALPEPPKEVVLAEEDVTDDVTDEELETKFVRVPRGKLSQELRNALFGPEVGT